MEAEAAYPSTFSQNRRRRFNQSQIYQEIFDDIVLQAVRRNMVGGKVLYTDSTHLKASANKNIFIEKEVAKSTRDYLEELEKDVTQDRCDHGKKPLKCKEEAEQTKIVKVSTTDPDSGYMIRDGKPKVFFYLDYRTVDSRHSIITDTYVTPANVHDSIPCLSRLDRQLERFGFVVEAVGLDAGYSTAAICKGLEDRHIFGVIGYRRFGRVNGRFTKRDFTYDESIDCYVCPGNCLLRYKTTNREGFREYDSGAKFCKNCLLLSKCTTSKNSTKIITRHVWELSKERINANRRTDRGKMLYTKRKETVERSYADSKELQGHRYAKMRGLSKIREQCHYTLSDTDRAMLVSKRGEQNRLGFAVQLCCLRFPGQAFTANGAAAQIPRHVVEFVAEQLGIEPQAFTAYARRDETRREHLLELRMALGMRTFDGQTRQALSAWLLPVAMGTDKGVVLVETLLEEMRRRQIIIPNLMVVERLAEETRSTARRDTYRAVLHGLTETQIEGLEGLLRIRPDGEQSWLAWLRKVSDGTGAKSFLRLVERLDHIRALGVDLDRGRSIHRNRLAQLACEGGRSTVQHLAEYEPERRQANRLAHPEKARSLPSTERLGPRPQGTGEIGANAVHPPLAGGSWPEAQGEPGAEQRRGPERPGSSGFLQSSRRTPRP